MAKRKEMVINYLWPDADRGPWEVRLLFQPVKGKVRCVGMGIYPYAGNPPRVPLTRTIVKNVPFADLLDKARTDPAHDLSALLDAPTPVKQGAIKIRRPADGAAGRKAGRPPRPATHYAAVTRIYLQSPTKPTTAVAEHFGVPVSTAAKWVAKARALRMLGQTTPGKVGGASTATDPP